MNGDADILAQRVFTHDGVCLCGSIDPIKAAVRKRRKGKRQNICRELNTVEPVATQLSIAVHTLMACPLAVAAQIGESIEIHVDPKTWCTFRPFIDKARPGNHSQQPPKS